MQLFEVFRQSIDSLRANKLRSSLTLLAIAVGVFAIVGANTAVRVLDSFFKDTLSLMGGDVITVSKFPQISMGPLDWDALRNRQNITVEQMERLEDLTVSVQGIGPNRTYRVSRISYGELETEPNVSITGGNEHYLANNAYTIEDGRNFLPEELDRARQVAIIGADVVEMLFPVENPIGKTIRYEGRPYVVIGTTEAKGNVFGNTLDRFVLFPYTHLSMMYGRNQNVSIQVRAGSVDKVQTAIDELTGFLRVIRKVDPALDNDFEISTNQTLGAAFDQFTGVLYIIGFVVGGIVLLGAGIGVMNIMLVSVTERTREIGIRKAVGATRSSIVSQFLAETIFICQIGGIIGILAGVGLGNLAAIYFETAIVIPWSSVIMGVVGITIIGLVFGVYPAMKAARLDPIESLRYE
ncbi:MAG: ABC transporter permease [Balneolaceae bacterium]